MAKIALIGPVYPYRGGIAHYTTLLDRTLRSAGHELLLISFRRQYPSWLFPGRSDKDPSQEPLSAGETHYWIDSINPFTWLQTFARVRRYGPDLLILQWWSTFWAPVWITLMVLNRLFLRSPVLIICHNVLPHERRRYDILLTKRTLGMATRLIVQSAEEEQRLLRLLPDAVIAIAPHPKYDMFVHQSLEQSEAREALGLPSGEPILLFFGIIRPYKGLSELIRALPTIRQSVDAIRLIIAGEFWEDRQSYVRLIDELDLNDVIIIDDRYIPNEEVAAYFSAADALAAPYRFKTGSGVAQMANAFHLPVITVGLEDQAPYAESPTEGQRSQQIAEAVIGFCNGKRANVEEETGSPATEKTTEEVIDPSWKLLVETIEASIGFTATPSADRQEKR